MSITNRQKMEYIQRNQDMISVDLAKIIYNIINRNENCIKSICTTKNPENGIPIDLAEIKDAVVLDTIYNLLKKRVDSSQL